MSDGVGWVVGLGGLLLAAFVVAAVNEVVKHYSVIMSVGGAVSGALLGVLAGAGIGVIVPHVGRCYCRKAAIGPLSRGACLSSAARLLARYPGVAEDKNEKPWQARIRPAVAVVLLCSLLFATATLTENAYLSAHPDEKVLVPKKGELATASRPTGPRVPSGGSVVKPSPLAPVLGNLLVEHFHERGYEYGWFGGSANDGDASKFTFFKVTDIVLDGDHLKICYDWQQGVLSGTLSGNTFRGTIRQDNASGGSVELVFDHDMSAAKGWWRRANGRTKYKAMLKTSGH